MPGAWLTWVTLGCSCLAGIDGIIHSLAPECHQRAGHTKAPPRGQAHSQATCLPMQQLLFSLAGRQRMLSTGRSYEQYVFPPPMSPSAATSPSRHSVLDDLTYLMCPGSLVPLAGICPQVLQECPKASQSPSLAPECFQDIYLLTHNPVLLIPHTSDFLMRTPSSP